MFMSIKTNYISIGFLFFIYSVNVFSDTNVSLDNGKFISNEEITVKHINCEGVNVEFARGIRSAPEGYEPVISVGGHDTLIKLPKSCYTNMICKYYKGKPAVVIIDAPACGGNAVGEEYIVIDLNNLHKDVLGYLEAKKLNLTD